MNRSTRVVATAGHVDHGKSTLIEALTGTDPDRFPEEKARGLTIDLGYAFTDIGPFTVGFVDVPGHVRFVRNMLSGVGAVEVALLVVAANEGWMPQTAEHAQILELFGVEHGVIALTKSDLVDAETIELARLELAERLTGTSMASWPIVPVAARDEAASQGLDALRDELRAALERAPAPADRNRARLWVDRSFAAKGAGTVVTGTLTMGSVSIDDTVWVEPGHRPARVRGIQSGHARTPTVAPGTRVALNLVGIDHTAIQRGMAVTSPDHWALTNTIDIVFTPVPGAPTLPKATSISVHVGSSERAARWRRLDAEASTARLRFDVALPLQPGDRIVLRSTARRQVVGGGIVFDVDPQRGRRSPFPHPAPPSVQEVVERYPWGERERIVQFGGLDPTTVDAELQQGRERRTLHEFEGTWVDEARYRTLADTLSHVVRTSGIAAPDDPGVTIGSLCRVLGIDARVARAVVEGIDGVVIDRDIVRRADDLASASTSPDGQRLLAALRTQRFAPPTPDELGVEPALVRQLAREGVVQQLDSIWFASEAIDDAAVIVSRALRARETLTMSEIRELLGTTRKFALPIANALDATGVTRRRGDQRIAGPRVRTD